ncbi:metal-dependent phosphohydrolase [Acidiphilium multivorum]|uniref:YfbR-like 5'-deoxynucleotidase n=1 Tax=Acidiphilium multivorum TaxID=62140 RepID=UPI001F4BCE75|nr:YfbR-like 5'-deoxynucleotidase [Acidiphilium multivorum]UNC12886.1 metal-dependent phosphohydrolase [Acidiphilium multivorum]
MEPRIMTASGLYFDFDRLSSNMLSIDTIAQALSHICRFSGHTSRFYSVAQHSVHVANCHCVPRRHRLAALMHDAAEAFLGDVSTPLKQMLPDYQALERRVEEMIFFRFGIAEIPADVWKADKIMLATEGRDLMPLSGEEWATIAGEQPLPALIRPWSPGYARDRFLDLYHELQSGKAA